MARDGPENPVVLLTPHHSIFPSLMKTWAWYTYQIRAEEASKTSSSTRSSDAKWGSWNGHFHPHGNTLRSYPRKSQDRRQSTTQGESSTHWKCQTQLSLWSYRDRIAHSRGPGTPYSCSTPYSTPCWNHSLAFPKSTIDWANSHEIPNKTARVKSWSVVPRPGQNLHFSSWIQGLTTGAKLPIQHPG